jgi:Flp pilus assembly protein TadD
VAEPVAPNFGSLAFSMSLHLIRRAALFISLLAPVALAQDLPPGTHSADDTDPAHMLAQAEDLIGHEDYARATALLNQLLQARPGDARALYDLGFAADASDRPADAETAWRHAIEFDPKQFESRLALGILLARQGDADAAREQLLAAIALQPATGSDAAKAPAYRALARLNASKDPIAASDELQQAIKLSQESASDTLLAAELAENVGDLDDAEKAYRRLLSRDAQAPDAVSGLAHLLVREKKLPKAETLLTQTLAAHPDDPALTAQLAGVYGAENRADEAVPLLEALHQASPADANIERMLAELYTQTGDAAKAEPLYVDLLAHGAPSAALLAERGENLIRQSRYADAQAILRRSVDGDPGNGNAWSGLAFAASENHDPQTCLDALTNRAKFLPETPATIFLTATSFDHLHQYKLAEQYYHRFLDAAGGKFPDQEWQARHRLVALANMK